MKEKDVDGFADAAGPTTLWLVNGPACFQRKMSLLKVKPFATAALIPDVHTYTHMEERTYS